VELPGEDYSGNFMATDLVAGICYMSLANIITLARLPLLLLLVGLLFVPSFEVRLTGLALLIVLFLMDWFDGYVARLRNEVTELGAVLDIALDRSVENILWITF
jgi:CDP-diacylglycerol--glycerol-3-phosphate 3-phosphatidyltransferase